jgi:ABC-type sulfate transport system substrate-binding protein
MKAPKYYYRAALTLMQVEFEEKRSDVTDYITMILDEEPIEDLMKFKSEARFIQAGGGQFLVQYDTLTTTLHISVDNGVSWKEMTDHKYIQEK